MKNRIKVGDRVRSKGPEKHEGFVQHIVVDMSDGSDKIPVAFLRVLVDTEHGKGCSPHVCEAPAGLWDRVAPSKARHLKPLPRPFTKEMVALWVKISEGEANYGQFMELGDRFVDSVCASDVDTDVPEWAYKLCKGAVQARQKFEAELEHVSRGVLRRLDRLKLAPIGVRVEAEEQEAQEPKKRLMN